MQVLASVILFLVLKDGKIIYDIKFPLYYNNKERNYIKYRSLDIDYILSLLEER